MTEEVRAVVSFGQVKRGDRLQVDIHDEKVAGLIKAGYLKIIWKEPADAGSVDSAEHPAGSEHVPAGRVGSRAASEPEEEVDGPGEHRPAPEDPDSP